MSTLSNGIEATTRKFLDEVNSGTGPQIFEMSVEDARQFLTKAQSSDVKKLPADIEDVMVPGGPNGDVSVRIARPKGASEALPAIIYVHGAGWVLGGWESHDRLVLELANRAHAAVVFVNYSLSPEAKYPTAIEECYVVAKHIADNAKKLNIDASKMAIAGDSVGGNMATAVTMLCKERSGPRIDFQVLFYPVTEANFETESYNKFETKHFLSRQAMKWFWNHYTSNDAERKKPTVSPLLATVEQLKGLPPAMVFTAEFDVLRDEGEAYAHKLIEAGVEVRAARCLGTIHDFVMLHALAETPAARFAVETASAALKERLHAATAAAVR
ncbi:MAG: alpha/beta hydrolase [Candidatus Melainabacteria bacterium]|nr:alpha/beta hydrolase [Candidatus Melainabacteria bacterium]